jgi:diguanylate cyclase (GGDEF)-like protein/PAS domain S-box-containing protein
MSSPSSSSFPSARVQRRRRWALSTIREAGAKALSALPRGQTLPDREWASRHRALLWILWGQVVGLTVFMWFRGLGVWGSIGPVLPLVVAAGAGMLPEASRRARSVAVVFGLLTSSAVLVYAWNGQIEAHFHFFVMIALLAMYEDWLPFGLAVAYVAVEHGVLGAIAPHAVYSHGGNPWVWAAIHGGFVLAAAAAGVATWRLNEDTRDRMVEADLAARRTAARFQAAFEGGISGMAMTSPDGRFLRVNQALREMLGYSEDELVGQCFSDVTHPEDRSHDAEHVRPLLDGAIDVYETEKRYVHRDGSVVWVQLGVKPIRDEAGRVEYFIAQTNDITARKGFEQELAHRALHDPLTGLPNRTLFLDRLTHALVRLARRPGELTVLFVDLDRFKLVNDAMGHGVGDAVLLETAARLRAAVRSDDTVARFGGDEFTIVCENAGPEESCSVAQRILDSLSEPFALQGREFRLSASVGIRSTDDVHASADALLRDADSALYVAKDHGRGRFEVFDGESSRGGADLLATEQALRRAISGRELRLHYQPEVALSDGRIVAVEALVRWEHPERGIVSPAEFIPLAEESGLIVALGEWVLHEACSQLATWRAAGTAGPQLRVAVNVSGRQLSHPGLPETVAAALTAAGLDPSRLCLEITESALVRDTGVALATLRALQALGVGIALDDFGVGFSSLSRIRELPAVDVIKIDRSFIAGVRGTGSDRAVVKSVLSLAAQLGVTVVAEGIERADQWQALRELRCEVGQGYLFARPQPPAELESLLCGGVVGLPVAGALAVESAGG